MFRDRIQIRSLLTFMYLDMAGEVESLQDGAWVGEEGELCRHLQVLPQQLREGDRLHSSLACFCSYRKMTGRFMLRIRDPRSLACFCSWQEDFWIFFFFVLYSTLLHLPPLISSIAVLQLRSTENDSKIHAVLRGYGMRGYGMFLSRSQGQKDSRSRSP